MNPRTLADGGAKRDDTVAYIMKRYPRLTETFIVNEIRAMERLGAKLHIFSLLSPEPPPHHPIVAEVAATVDPVPQGGPRQWLAMAAAHGAAMLASPPRYGGAFARACLWSVQSSNPPSVWRQFFRAGYVATRCRRLGIRRMHAHFANAPSAVAHFANLMTGIPFSFTAHAKDIYLTRPPVIQRRVKAATFVATCTGYNARHLSALAGTDGGKIKLVYHGIDLAQFSAREAARLAAPATPLILSVGRLVPKKGHDDLIEACALLAAQGLAFRCRIVGEGPLRRDLEAQIKAAGLSGRVSLDGAMTHSDLIHLYRTADLFVIAPRIAGNGDRDGIPNVIAEAMAVGVPVVSTDVSGIPELVRPGLTGRLAPPNSPAGLAGAIAAALGSRGQSATMAAAARVLLQSEFDLWTTTRRLHALMACGGCGDAAHAEPEAALERPDAIVPCQAFGKAA